MVGGGRGECHRRFKTVVDGGFFLGEGGPITTDLPLLTPKTGGDALVAIEMSNRADCDGLVQGRGLYTV